MPRGVHVRVQPSVWQRRPDVQQHVSLRIRHEVHQPEPHRAGPGLLW
ncbi:hypothetical protein E2C01_088519 [Portunus trituberculatus]|uniref:Uncharacterized protein n=1 Tax=Portunus trituberculatus TaxID=210409 RepID=A0A5B7JG77_PORTR|nr:hypothetical protein [Portunus trituberculatus]